ncbi:hypothetical protein Tco_0326770 [Tanacetum coccineum]
MYVLPYEAKATAEEEDAIRNQTELNVSDNEEYDDQSDDVANKEKTDEEAAKRKAELLVELKAIETILEKKLKMQQKMKVHLFVKKLLYIKYEANNEEDADNNEENADNEEDAKNNEEDDENEEDAENEKDADNNEEDDDNEEDADNEDQADNEENVDQVFRNIKMLSFLNAAKMIKERKKMAKTGCNLENVNPQNEAEDDEDVKSISSDDVIVETKKKGRKSKGKKEGEKIKKAEE